MLPAFKKKINIMGDAIMEFDAENISLKKPNRWK